MNNIVNPKKPEAKGFKFMVRNQTFEVANRFITGSEILEMAGLTPVNNYRPSMKMQGNRYQDVQLEQLVDLGKPGIEKFTYISRDQTEG